MIVFFSVWHLSDSSDGSAEQSNMAVKTRKDNQTPERRLLLCCISVLLSSVTLLLCVLETGHPPGWTQTAETHTLTHSPGPAETQWLRVPPINLKTQSTRRITAHQGARQKKKGRQDREKEKERDRVSKRKKKERERRKNGVMRKTGNENGSEQRS